MPYFSRQTLINFLCFAYFATLLATPDSYKYIAILLALTALALLPRTYRFLKSPPALLVTASFMLYFLVTLAFAVPSGQYEQLDMPSRVLLAVIIFACLLRYPPSLKAVLYGCSIGASVVGVIALYQHYGMGIRALSSGGFMSIQVAGMAASLSVFSIFAYIFGCQRSLPVLKKIAFVGITLGFVATLLSGGRGAWVVTPFVALWAVIYYRNTFNRRDYMAMAASVTLIVVTAIVPALHRAGLVFSDLDQYQTVKSVELATEQAPEMKPKIKTSSGTRVELWRTAWLLWTDNPLTGTGYDRFTEKKQDLVDQRIVDPVVMLFSRAHNQLLEELQIKGIIGGLALVFLLLAPWVATKKIQCKPHSDQGFACVVLRCHIVLIAGYMLTQHYINHHSGILFFTLGVVIFASMALRLERS
ncbi:O-antigen ligase family protein [Salinivibrio sp. PR919]|uniref:O-antigen ligase family protein n=1 Tax=Salinivibrio sp. PR919 TaxID=1909491 RepID=UPI0013010730|nr:O-antigen ligase family protein [Salinivibrio sp. PR919]